MSWWPCLSEAPAAIRFRAQMLSLPSHSLRTPSSWRLVREQLPHAHHLLRQEHSELSVLGVPVSPFSAEEVPPGMTRGRGQSLSGFEESSSLCMFGTSESEGLEKCLSLLLYWERAPVAQSGLRPCSEPAALGLGWLWWLGLTFSQKMHSMFLSKPRWPSVPGGH